MTCRIALLLAILLASPLAAQATPGIKATPAPALATIGGPIHADDIVSIARLHGAVGVLWSDQANHRVSFRIHRDSAPISDWDPTEHVLDGRGIADDHINFAVAPDGTLYAATKNSIDVVGEPQLGLYIRRPSGDWEIHPYAPRTANWEPTRPIVQVSSDGETIFLAHSAYDRRRPRREFAPIFLISARATDLRLGSRAVRTILGARSDLNTVCGPKRPLPGSAPGVLLASDATGDVWEIVLPRTRRL